MDTEHLDNLVAIAYWGLGRSLSQTVYLLKGAMVPTPSGGKGWQQKDVALALKRHEQRKSNELESF